MTLSFAGEIGNSVRRMDKRWWSTRGLEVGPETTAEGKRLICFFGGKTNEGCRRQSKPATTTTLL